MTDFESLSEKKEYIDHLFNTLRGGLLILNKDLYVKKANSSFCNLFEVSTGETEGKLLYELGDNQWDIPELRNLLEKILPEEKVMKDYQIEQEFENIGQRIMLLNARRIDDAQLILLSFEDVTERKQAMREVKEAKKNLEERVEESNKQVRKLTSRLTEIEQKERSRIADILHDDLQQNLVAIQINLNSLHQQIKSNDLNEQLSEKISKVTELSDQAIEKTRQLSSDLNPSVLKSEELAKMLNWLVKRFDEMHNLKIDLQAKSHFKIYDEETRVVMLKILRELLFNIVKHAETDQAIIRVHKSADEQMIVQVIDEGKGFDINEVDDNKQFGLFSIRERLNLISGTLEVDSAPGKGTCMMLKLPLGDKISPAKAN